MVLTQMMHFIKRMLESGIWSLGSSISSTSRKMNFLLYLLSLNESTIPKELIPATKMDLDFQTTPLRNIFLIIFPLRFLLTFVLLCKICGSRSVNFEDCSHLEFVAL
jgi:hypothetical protein